MDWGINRGDFCIMPNPTATNPLGMSSMKEVMNVSYGELIRDIIKRIFTWDWIFSKWYEKIIVLGSIIFAMISVVRWIF